MAKREKSWRRVVVVLRYADDLGYVPISSVAREAVHNSPGRLRGVEVSELFWAAMSGTKLRLILRLNDSRTPF